MIPTTLFVEPNQEKRIRLALQKRKGCRIKTRKIVSNGNYNGLLKGEMLLTQSQWKKYHKAKAGETVALPFLHKHLEKNMHHKGGFLSLILAALAPILGGVAGGLIERGIAGAGLHPPKLVWCKKTTKQSTPVAFEIKSAARGNGLYLSPWTGHSHFKSGTGLYLSPYPYHNFGSGVHLKKVEHSMLPKYCPQFSPKQHSSVKHLL